LLHDVCVTDSGGRAVPATGLFALVVVELASVAVGWPVTGMSFGFARDSFMITNAAIGGCCAVCGVLIARHRPGNRLGWLLLGAGVCQTGTAAVTPWFVQGLTGDAPVGAVRWLSTLYSLAWPWSVALFIPLALLHFPDGRLPGAPWRAVALLAVVNAPVQVLEFSADPNPLATVAGLVVPADGRAASWLAVPDLVREGWPQALSEVVVSGSYLAGLVLLVVRYRRGNHRTRQQLLWLLLAATVAVAVIAAERLIPGPLQDRDFPIIVTLAIALVPVAMTIAVLRYRLLDIRLVWSRAVTYGLLTAAGVAGYLGLVNVGDAVLRRQLGGGTSVVATLMVAAGFNPVRVRLQGAVDRLLYGERTDPVRAAASVTAQLAAGAERPADVLPALCHALRLPYAGLSDVTGRVGEHGTPTERMEAIPLRHAGERVGELRVGVRSGQRQLDPADRAVLELMAVPIGMALRAGALSEEVQRSRRAIVTAREEERRRLRRDLHDGLGPTLTGIAFQADAVVNLAGSDPDEVRTLGTEIRCGVTGAIQDVRQLIYQLRPTALDELGLVEALRRQAQRHCRRADGAILSITVTAPERLPALPAAVEVAAYRIVTEALTNVARHSCATAAAVAVELDGDAVLALIVQDDGEAADDGWTPGVGLASMRERAAELGGTLAAEPTPVGGRVQARLPTGAAT
jgi:two-component system NarL family sensor kinase